MRGAMVEILRLLTGLQGVWRGKGLARTLMNLELEQVKLQGVILDIGGRGKPSYLRFLEFKPSSRLFVLDIVHDESVDVVGSIEQLR
jgi:predicted N-acetyltransferase YhbS